MRYYFEFSDNEYYALVAVEVDEEEILHEDVRPFKKATEFYVEIVAGDSVEQVLEEAHPYQRTKEYAFMKYTYALKNEKLTVSELVDEFEDMSNGVLLIDGSLV